MSHIPFVGWLTLPGDCGCFRLFLHQPVVAKGKTTRVHCTPVATGTWCTVVWPEGLLATSVILQYHQCEALQLSLTTRTLLGNMLLSLLISCTCYSSLPCLACCSDLSLFSPSFSFLLIVLPSVSFLFLLPVLAKWWVGVSSTLESVPLRAGTETTMR